MENSSESLVTTADLWNQSSPPSAETHKAWSISGNGSDLKRLISIFNRLAERSVAALKVSVSPTATAADVWLSRVHGFHRWERTSYARNHWKIKDIFEASAEYCAELKKGFHRTGDSDAEEKFAKLEKKFRRQIDPQRDPSAIRSREPLADPKAELDYWKAHVWRGYDNVIKNWAREDGLKKLKLATRNLCYELAVQHTNYVIACGLRGEGAMQAFDNEIAELRKQVDLSWRATCKRLVISFEDGQEEVNDQVQGFDRVREDLQRFLSELPAEPQGKQLETELKDLDQISVNGSTAERATTCLAATPDLESKPFKKRGRPTKISNELKQEALGVRGGRARAQILYGTKYPRPQQVKNVSAILRHFQRTHQTKG